LPEIWVPYGSVEVAIDIRIENILESLEKTLQTLTNDEIKQKLSQINFSGKVGIFVADDYEPCLKLAAIIGKVLVEKNYNNPDVQFIVPRKSAASVRKRLEELPFRVSMVQVAEGEPIAEVYGDVITKILLSQVGFDGLFGFSGGLVSMTRAIESQVIGNSFIAHPILEPSSGTSTEAAKMVWENATQLGDVLSISVVPSQGDVNDIAIGDLQSSQKVAEEKFLKASSKTIAEKARAAIISPGRNRVGETLSSSVKSIWNILGGLRDKSTIVLLAECGEGLGAEAFKLYGAGRLDSEDLSRLSKYIEGLEDLVFLQEISKAHELVVVSALPNYYIESKFGLKSAKKASDALNHLLSSQGSRTKALIVPQASETLLKV